MGNNNKGLTLIELMIVIAIIGILASVIVVFAGDSTKNAKIAKTKAEMRQFGNVLQSFTAGNNKVLHDFTSNWSSYLPACGDLGSDWRNVSDANPCMTAWSDALNKIADSNGVSRASLSALRRDAWGSPYFLDENELEYVSGALDLLHLCQRHDMIFSAGPDGKIVTPDDIYYGIPFASCPEGLPTVCPEFFSYPSGFVNYYDVGCP